MLSRENDLYGSYPVNQYVEPDMVVDLPKERILSQKTSTAGNIVSNSYMEPKSVTDTHIQVTENSEGIRQTSQNEYMNFKFDS